MQTATCTLSSGSFTMTFRDAATDVRTRLLPVEERVMPSCALKLSRAGCHRKTRVWRWSVIQRFIFSGKPCSLRSLIFKAASSSRATTSSTIYLHALTLPSRATGYISLSRNAGRQFFATPRCFHTPFVLPSSRWFHHSPSSGVCSCMWTFCTLLCPFVLKRQDIAFDATTSEVTAALELLST